MAVYSRTIELPDWSDLNSVIIGVDVGQRRDPTAILVGEQYETEDGGERSSDAYRVRYAQRLALGTSYPRVARIIAGIAEQLREEDERFARWATLLRQMKREAEQSESGAKFDPDELARYEAYPRRIIVRADATGVGRPVIDLLRDELRGMDVELCAVTLTATDRYDTRKSDGDVYEVSAGKAWLVSRLQALLQTRRIEMPDTPECRAVVEELLDYEIRVNDNASMQAGAFGTRHDDLATALGMIVIEPPSGGYTWSENPFNASTGDDSDVYWTDHRDAPTHDPLAKDFY